MSYDEKKKDYDAKNTEAIQEEQRPASDLIKDDGSDEIIMDASKRRVEERRLVRKLDTRLLPMIFLIYIMNYIDVSALDFVMRLPICPR